MTDLFTQNHVEAEKPTNESTTDKIAFDSVIGQDRVKSILERIIGNNRLANSYLFYGLEGCGKNALAIEFAKAINCRKGPVKPCQKCDICRQMGSLNHPDFKFVFAASKDLKEGEITGHLNKISTNPYAAPSYSSTAEILIHQVRELIKSASLKLYNASVRVFVLAEADKMRVEAANALLKLLEEPPENLILILTTSRLDKILPTISSRCQKVKFSPLSNAEIGKKCLERGIAQDQTEVISRLAMGNVRKAVDLTSSDFNELRDFAWQLLMSTGQSDINERYQFLSDLSRGRSRSEIKEIFLNAESWLRDVQIIANAHEFGLVRELLYNADQNEKIKQLLRLFNAEYISKALDKTEYYIDLVDRNIYINLIFINYLNDLIELQKNTAGL